jgi:hypothetical protein
VSDDDPAAATDYPADTSLVEVLGELERRGYAGHFDVDDDSGTSLCVACGEASAVDEIVVEDSRRLEGASDPSEMASVLAVRCPHCQVGGTAVCRYGPEASAGEAALLRAARGATATVAPDAESSTS